MRNNWILIIVLTSVSCGGGELRQLTDLDYYDRCRELVLEENQKGQKFFFERAGKTVDELEITYLGMVNNATYDSIKILNSVNIVGYEEDTKNASGTVFLYTRQNQQIGRYHVGAGWAVVKEIQSDSLIFDYNNDFCDQRTSIFLRDSIAQNIFINCTEEGGDLFSFVKE